MKTFLVTGGGRGLARGLCLSLVRAGHRVVLTARSRAAGEATARAAPPGSMEVIEADLASFRSIDAAATNLTTDVDGIIHVAGVLQQSPVRRLSADGFEETLAVNALAPFLLTRRLFHRLKPGGRVVCVSSRLHLPGSRGVPVRFDFEDPNLERGYHPERAYKNSKLALNWFTFELARRVAPSRAVAHAVCPGFVPETVAVTSSGFSRLLMKYVLPRMPFATRYDDAVDSLCFMALDPALSQATGGFWAEKKPFEASPQSRDVTDARRFWSWAE